MEWLTQALRVRYAALRLAVGVFCIASLVLGQSAGMQPVDRDRLLAHYAMTEDWIRSEVAGLSKEQLAFRAAEDTWSIAEVLEHLAVAEPQYWKQVQDSLNEPAPDPEKLPNDAAILWYGIDRSERNRTGRAREPQGQFGDAAKALASFLALRAEMRSFYKNTGNDLRAHYLQQSTMSVYQWALMISTHSQRHILQIRAIKASPRFPR
jgi:uncharacterized damage-inducible protein DinB